MRARSLRRKILIEHVTETRDAIGGVIETWSTFAVRHASVEPLNGREYFDSRATQADVTIRFRIRYLEGTVPKMRVNYNSRLFDIESVIDTSERHKEMLLMCKESV